MYYLFRRTSDSEDDFLFGIFNESTYQICFYDELALCIDRVNDAPPSQSTTDVEDIHAMFTDQNYIYTKHPTLTNIQQQFPELLL